MTKPVVVIRALNEAGRIGAAIENATHQTYPGTLVAVLVDGRCKDDTLARALEYDSWNVRVIEHEGTTLWGATEIAYRQVRGDVFVFLDCDNLMEPDRVFRQLEHMESDPRHPVVSAARVRVVGRAVSEFPMEATLDYGKLLCRNQYDALCLMVSGRWARSTLLPLMEKADRMGMGEMIDDYFTVLAAAAQNGLAYYPDIMAGEYRVRGGSLSERRSAADPTQWTRQAALSLLGREPTTA